MPDAAKASTGDGNEKNGKTSGWYVLFLAWIIFAGAYFAFSKTTVTGAPDITNYRILEIAGKFGSFIGAALGLVSFLVSGIIYLIVRAFAKGSRRAVALLLTALTYAFWLWHGYDLLYVEPRFTEVARAIITYTGKPTLYAAAIVCGLSLLGFILSIVARAFKKRAS